MQALSELPVNHQQTELSSVGRALDCRSKGRWFNSGSSDFFFFTDSITYEQGEHYAWFLFC